MADTIDEALEQLAQDLDRAQQARQPVAQWSGPQALTLEQAYRVQSRGVALRVARGDRVVGRKLGFTNRVAMQRMGIAEPVTGLLCQSMQLADGGTLDMAQLFTPRVEVEVVFKLAQTLPADVTAQQVLERIESLAMAIEIVDSRYSDFRFVAHDIVADNAFGCGFVVGPWMPPSTEVGQRAATLEIDGVNVASGNTAVILDHPLQALCSAARVAARDGRPLQAGSLVLAGSAIDPFGIVTGNRVQARIDGLGTVGFIASGD